MGVDRIRERRKEKGIKEGVKDETSLSSI